MKKNIRPNTWISLSKLIEFIPLTLINDLIKNNHPIEVEGSDIEILSITEQQRRVREHFTTIKKGKNIFNTFIHLSRINVFITFKLYNKLFAYIFGKET